MLSYAGVKNLVIAKNKSFRWYKCT